MHTYTYTHRLRYVLSCIRIGVPEIWALAHWEKQWLALVRESVHWMWTLLCTQEGFTDSGQAWSAWSEEAKLFPGRWKARIRLRRATGVALRKEKWQVTTATRRIA